MDSQTIAACATALVQARQTRTLIEALPAEPTSVAEAHAIQDRVASLINEPVGAFKANAPPAQEATRGLIFAPMVFDSPAQLSPAAFPHLGVEGEIAFRFKRDLPPRTTLYTSEEVSSAMSALPAIEIVSGRLRDPRLRPALEQLADGMANGGLVCGPETQDWAALRLGRLRVTLRVNDSVVVDSEGGHPIGDPLAVAVALVNMMTANGGVKAGQVVTTGSWTGLRFLKPGDLCVVTFEALGTAEVVFSP